MSQTTPNYGLPTGLVADDFIEPSHHNMLADTLDRALGSFLLNIMADGALNGWQIAAEKQVTAGQGLIAACWCKTAQAQDITGLTSGILNYVFATATAQSPDQGAAAFIAQPGSTPPAGAIFLGTITLDAEGEVTEFDNDAEGVDRNLMLLEIGAAQGEGCVEDVPAGGEIIVTVDHSEAVSFIVPGAIELQVEGEQFEYEVKGAHSATGFEIAATNTSEDPQDFVYAWSRRGFVGAV